LCFRPYPSFLACAGLTDHAHAYCASDSRHDYCRSPVRTSLWRPCYPIPSHPILVSEVSIRTLCRLRDRLTLQLSLLNAVALKDEIKEKAKGDEDAALGVFADDKKHLVVAITTDRGLCGSVNSSLSRALRKELDLAAKEGSDLRLFVLGEKGRAQIARDYHPIVARSVDGYMDRDPIFALASALATRIIAEPYEMLTLWYNQYENQVKFHNVYKKIPQLTAGGAAAKMPASLAGYEVEPEGPELMLNLQEYAVAAALYYAMLETVACETSQRVTAMDNASTNAKDMVDRFKLIYNRARQAKITTELTEVRRSTVPAALLNCRRMWLWLRVSILNSHSCCFFSSAPPCRLFLAPNRCNPMLPVIRVAATTLWWRPVLCNAAP